ncbi:hypothetical protein [Paracoccus spongiarum]|uniref:Major facilitator superfamily (MFS) profile domain-containing protein n=1 Tax=Paracoccus spongiarum TaxID=3064387 RepID=A0ABT9JCS9_9RHOB|nr:hypothetical protein [Paracoccus sp. 2205BS29-5]MDP5307520.1 hypothetical protein [Paracoccus sp. 2205BS29-5]
MLLGSLIIGLSVGAFAWAILFLVLDVAGWSALLGAVAAANVAAVVALLIARRCG